MNPEPRKPGIYELPRGSVVGKYEIMRRLAIGGMAEIYLARVTGAAGFEKLVVLKRILPSVAEDPAFVQMFLDEARLAATLRHPNIADVYDVGEDNGTYFFTMEYVYGQDARSIRHEAKKANERIPLTVALAIVHGIASALDHAHEKLGADGKPLHLVHRDVSASNIIVSYDGAVKLLDFGIARAASSTHKTQTGTLKGKVPYMSPEQCKNLPLDRRSDLFSLGTCLYEITVGRRPFRGDSDFEVMDQIVHKGATKPSELVEGYPPELEAIVMKLLERAPTMRYPTGEDLLHDLDEFIAKHGLWLSPRAIGKYMRTTFAEKIQAWEQAEQEGVPFAQHVAHTITSQSQRSELLTPPSSIDGVGPRTTSEEMAAIQAPIGKRMSSKMPAMQPLTPLSPAQLPVALRDSEAFQRVDDPLADSEPVAQQPAPFAEQTYPDSSPFERQSEVSLPMYPALRPKSSRTILFAFVAALVLGVGGLVGFMMNKRDKPVAAAVDREDSPKPMIETPVKADPVEPAAVETVETKRLPTLPVVDTQPTVPDSLPAQNAPVQNAEQSPVQKADVQKALVQKPPVQKPPVQKPPAQKPPAPKLVKKKPPPSPEPKEKTWDPNSPFLPQ
ncbi:MAG TPA: serine/threonine-protein kinase [Kofleriaceae bacterium]